jgi:replication fork clamp-binding protein CrfC
VYSSNVTEQIEGIRQKTIAVLDELMANAADFDLADPPAAFERYRGKLRENSYEVLVVGEAKRGKSTFVNALIGRDILPTDVDVATSQVFNIRPSEREAYRMRYEDGSEREILPPTRSSAGSRLRCPSGSCQKVYPSWTRRASGRCTRDTPRSRTASCRRPTR